MNQYAIFGAGQVGYAMLKLLPNRYYYGLIDNDPEKQGQQIGEWTIFSVADFLAQKDRQDVTVIFTVPSEKDNALFEAAGISCITKKEFLLQTDVLSYRDDWNLSKYRRDTWLKNRCFLEEMPRDFFRKDYVNAFNKELVEAMRRGNLDKADQMLVELGKQYELELPVDENGMYFDEYFSYRFDMRLAERLVYSGGPERAVCDLACGHGEMLKALQKRCRVTGVDLTPERVEACKAIGIEAYLGDAADTGLPAESFDVVLSQENLEHVADPMAVLKEARRLLKPGGMLYVAVPLGRDCDCQEHVNFFSVNQLYSMLVHSGFEVENIITMPYVNENVFDNNIFAGAVKTG